jgi:hypothetical protein
MWWRLLSCPRAVSTHLYPLTNGSNRSEIDYGVVSVAIPTQTLRDMHAHVLAGEPMQKYMERCTANVVQRRIALLHQPFLGMGGQAYYDKTAERVNKAFQALSPEDVAGKAALVQFGQLQNALWSECKDRYETGKRRSPSKVDVSLVSMDVEDIPALAGPVGAEVGMMSVPGAFASDDVAEEVSRRFLKLGAALYCGTNDEATCNNCVKLFLEATQKQVDDIVSDAPSDRPLASTIDFTAEVLQCAIAEAPWKYRADEVFIARPGNQALTIPVESMNNAMEVMQTIAMHDDGKTECMVGADCEDCAKGQTSFLATLRNHIGAKKLPHNDAIKQLLCLYSVPMTALVAVNASHVGAMDSGKMAQGLHCIGTLLPQTLFADSLSRGDGVSRAYAGAGASDTVSLDDMLRNDSLRVSCSGGRVFHTTDICARLQKNWAIGRRMGALVIEGTDMSPYCANPGMFTVKHSDGTVSEAIFKPEMSLLQVDAANAKLFADEAEYGVGGCANDSKESRMRWIASRLRCNKAIEALGLPIRAARKPDPRRNTPDFYKSFVRLYVPGVPAVLESTADNVVMQLRVGVQEPDSDTLCLSADIHDLVNGAFDKELCLLWVKQRDMLYVNNVHVPQFSNPPAIISGPSSPEEFLPMKPVSQQIHHALRGNDSPDTSRSHAACHYGLVNTDINSTTIALAHSQEVWECSMMFSVAVFLQSLARELPDVVTRMEPVLSRLAIEKPTNHKLLITVDTKELHKSRHKVGSCLATLGGSLQALYQTRDIRSKEVALELCIRSKQREHTAHQGACVAGFQIAIEEQMCRARPAADVETVAAQQPQEPLVGAADADDDLVGEADADDDLVGDADADDELVGDADEDDELVGDADEDDELVGEKEVYVEALVGGACEEELIGEEEWPSIDDDQVGCAAPYSDSSSSEDTDEEEPYGAGVGISKSMDSDAWGSLRKMPRGSHHTHDSNVRYYQSDIADTVVAYLIKNKPVASSTYSTAEIKSTIEPATLDFENLSSMYIISNGVKGHRIHSVFDELRPDLWTINQSAYDTLSDETSVMSACKRV